jgi:hypothetical protein
MAKVTSASNRSTRKSTQPVRQGQDPYRANRQAVSKATVSNSGQGVTPGSAKVTTGQGKQRVTLPNLPKPTTGTTNTIRATGANSNYSKINRLSETSAQPKPTAASNLAKSQQMLRNQVAPVGAAINGARGLGIQAIAEAVAPRPASARAGLKEGQAAANAAIKAKGKTADSFGGQYQKGKAAPSKAPKGQTKAKSFDNAFASARNSGMSSFVWDGKRYTTKMK